MEKTLEKQVKINLGCGNDYREGYINIDDCSMFPHCKIDRKVDIRTMTCGPESVDEVLVSHLVMYFRPEELLPLLITWHSWLKEGGVLKIETINLNEVLNHRTTEELLIPLFGKPDTAPHRWAYTFTSLYALLTEAGFEDIDPEVATKNPNRDFALVATK